MTFASWQPVRLDSEYKSRLDKSTKDAASADKNHIPALGLDRELA
jgi:hypothetical protein